MRGRSVGGSRCRGDCARVAGEWTGRALACDGVCAALWPWSRLWVLLCSVVCRHWQASCSPEAWGWFLVVRRGAGLTPVLRRTSRGQVRVAGACLPAGPGPSWVSVPGMDERPARRCSSASSQGS